MRRFFYTFTILWALVGCQRHSVHVQQEVKQQSVIEDVCKDFSQDVLTSEEITHWDSMNAEGGYLLIRGAERNLDTTVNHLHLIFTTEP